MADVVESSFQLRNFAEIAVQLPKLTPPRKLLRPAESRLWEPSGGNKPDQRTLTMRWPHEILKVHKSVVSLRPQNPQQQFSRTVRTTAHPFVPRKRSDLMKIDVLQHPMSVPATAMQLPLAINRYLKPGKQSPKAVLYYKSHRQTRSAFEPSPKKNRLLPQQCCGSFCNYTKIVVLLSAEFPR